MKSTICRKQERKLGCSRREHRLKRSVRRVPSIAPTHRARMSAAVGSGRLLSEFGPEQPERFPRRVPREFHDRKDGPWRPEPLPDRAPPTAHPRAANGSRHRAHSAWCYQVWVLFEGRKGRTAPRARGNEGPTHNRHSSTQAIGILRHAAQACRNAEMIRVNVAGMVRLSASISQALFWRIRRPEGFFPPLRAGGG